MALNNSISKNSPHGKDIPKGISIKYNPEKRLHVFKSGIFLANLPNVHGF